MTKADKLKSFTVWPKTGAATVSAILRSIEPLVPEVRLLVIVST